MYSRLFQIFGTLASPLFLPGAYPWDVIRSLEDFLMCCGPNLSSDYEEILENVWVGRGTVIAGSAGILGPAIIGCNSTIRSGAVIGANVLLGDNVYIGENSEVSSSLIFDMGKASACNSIADSVLGRGACLEEDVKIVSMREDKGPVVVELPGGDIVQTNLHRIGAFLGDYAIAGKGSILSAGCIIERRGRIGVDEKAGGFISAQARSGSA